MNTEHTNSRFYMPGGVRCSWVFIILIVGMAAAPILAMSFSFNSYFYGGAQGARASIDAEFSSTVAEMTSSGPPDTTAIEKLEKKALGILDGIILNSLAGNGGPDLDSLNASLANLGSQEHGFGETYRVVRMGGKPLVFALVADFGLGAPSAIRLYAEQGSTAHFAMTGEIDRFTQKDMLDDSLELLAVTLPEPASEVVFLTVAGRSDELQTGIFTAWRFDGKNLTQLWTSDLISHSTFQMSGGSLILTYCHDPADEDAKTCRSMVREKYAYSMPDGQWRQQSTESVPNPKH